MAKADDPIAVIEAAYRHDLDEEQWLGAIGSALAPWLDQGLGIALSIFDSVGGLEIRYVPVHGRPELSEGFVQATRDLGPEAIRRCMLQGPCSTMRQALGAHPALERMSAGGVFDLLGIVAADPTGKGVMLGVPLPSAWLAPAGMVARISRIAAHLAAGYRVRRMLGARADRLPDIFSGATAVLTPAGNVMHAETDAKPPGTREHLRHAALSMDRARGRLRREDPDDAVETWQALVSGRWSLVDHFDSDGRRLLVARRNDPHTERPALLTPRERQVVVYRALGHPLKLIAYELGLAVSTVSANLARGMKKLGIASDAELVELLAPTQKAGDEGGS